MLLCTWISNCPIAVTHFLHNQENVPFVSFLYVCVYVCVRMHMLVLVSLAVCVADSSNLREPGWRWEAGAGSVRSSAGNLHLLQRQLAGELHQVWLCVSHPVSPLSPLSMILTSGANDNSVYMQLNKASARVNPHRVNPISLLMSVFVWQREAEAADREENRERELCGKARLHHQTRAVFSGRSETSARLLHAGAHAVRPWVHQAGEGSGGSVPLLHYYPSFTFYREPSCFHDESWDFALIYWVTS